LSREIHSIMTARDRSIDRSPSPARAWRAVLIFVGGSLLIVAILWVCGSLSPRTPLAQQSDSDRAKQAGYVGSQLCGDCHPGEFASYSRSGHARTLQPAAHTPLVQRLNGKTLTDPERQGTTWAYSVSQGRLRIERREAGEVERFVIDYAFGSGHHATTFVTLTDRNPDAPTVIEHRLTVFVHKQSPDITPGQALGGSKKGIVPSGRRYFAADALKCFECHTTTTSDRGPRVLDEATMIPNVSCERCHGPGRSHVEAARRGEGDAALAMPFGLGRWTTVKQMRMCGACHRLPEMGDPSLIRTDNPVLVRFQPVGLMQSACYLRSSGALSCVSCHDPHAKTSTDVGAYEAVCLSCHQGSGQTPCKVSPANRCVGCHMPKREVLRGMVMTDHWIRARSETPVP
jgi:hypothetical protein